MARHWPGLSPAGGRRHGQPLCGNGVPRWPAGPPSGSGRQRARVAILHGRPRKGIKAGPSEPVQRCAPTGLPKMPAQHRQGRRPSAAVGWYRLMIRRGAAEKRLHKRGTRKEHGMPASRRTDARNGSHRLAYGCCLILGIAAQGVALLQPRLSGDLIAGV